MNNCIDIHGDPFSYFNCDGCDDIINSLFAGYDSFLCNDDRAIFPDGSRSVLNCRESHDIFHAIDNQDNECELSFCKCRITDKTVNRDVCSDNATWYVYSEPCGYWEDVRYPLYCKRGRYVNYRSKCDDMWLDNPYCYYPLKRVSNGNVSIANRGNYCHS